MASTSSGDAAARSALTRSVKSSGHWLAVLVDHLAVGPEVQDRVVDGRSVGFAFVDTTKTYALAYRAAGP